MVVQRDPANARKLTLPNHLEGEMGEVIAAANDLFEQISVNHWDAFRYMQTMGSHTSDAIIAYDVEGTLLYAYRPCVKLCGFKVFDNLKEAVGIPQFVLSPDAPPIGLSNCLLSCSFSQEVVMIGNDDQRIRVHLNAAHLPVSRQFPRLRADNRRSGNRPSANNLLRNHVT